MYLFTSERMLNWSEGPARSVQLWRVLFSSCSAAGMGRATHGLPPRSFLPHNLDKPDKYFKDLTNTQQIPDNLLSDVANLGIRASLVCSCDLLSSLRLHSSA